MDDINLLRRAVDDTTRIIDGVSDEQRALPTPCPAFTVGDLIDHLAGGAEMFATAADGTAAEESPEWKVAADHLLTAFTRPGALDGTVTVPYAELPGEIALQHALAEIAIHTTDVARATGQSIGDDEVYERVFGAVTADWRVENVLGPEVPCPDGASLLERVQAFAGRAV